MKNRRLQPQQTGRARLALLLPVMLTALLAVIAACSWSVTAEVLVRRDRFILDQYHRNGERTPMNPDVIILGIDDSSRTLDRLWPEDLEASPALSAMKKSYPFPRRVWAYVLDRMFEAGAKAVFLDLTFATPAPDPEDDRLLAEAIQKYGSKVVIGAKFDEQMAGEDKKVDLLVPVSSVLPQKASEPKRYGLLNYWPDFDDVVRTVNFRLTRGQADKMAGATGAVDSKTEPPLSHVTLLLAKNSSPQALQELPDEAHLRFGELSYYPPLSLHEIFVPDLWKNNFADGSFFKDRVIMVGAVASDLQDFQQTPIGRIAGVQLHAHTYAALLDRSFVHATPNLWRWLSLFTGFSLALILVSKLQQPVFCLLGLILGIGVAMWAGGFAFDHYNLEASPLLFSLAFGLCGLSGLSADFLAQLKEKRKLERFLARYTSPELMREMLTDRQGLYTTLSGVGRDVTILFSDVRGFTSMSEKMTPQEVVTQLNEYLSSMVERVFKQRGIVDKFIGDAVMALWGTTRAEQSEAACKEDAVQAVTCALQMREALAALNKDWESRGMSALHIGIGIHQGNVVVGNIGSESPFEKMDFTVIGDNVNTASRLEGATKEYGVDLIVSVEVQRHVADAFICRSADLVAVKGKLKPVEVFTIISKREGAQPVGLEDFELGVRLYREGDFSEALLAFGQAAAVGLDDALTHLYQSRCQSLIEEPPTDWTGVYVMTKK
jgi:adenylate cyclase